MRIIAGSLKGKNIPVPENYKARPTTDFAREGLFNILDSEYEFDDLSILDLFAGSGAISYEFISRGAGSSICVEMRPENAAFISRTASDLGIAKKLSVVRHNVFEFLPICTKKFDIVFADPPYALEGLDTLPDKVFEAEVLHPGAYFILEHPDKYDFSSHPHFVKTRKYGNVHFTFFE